MIDPTIFVLFTLASVVGCVIPSVMNGAKFMKWTYGTRRKFHIESYDNNGMGFNAVMCWLLCYQHLISESNSSVTYAIGPYNIRLPVPGYETKFETPWGTVYIETIGTATRVGGICISVYKRYWYTCWWFFGLGLWYEDKVEINRLNWFINQVYTSVGYQEIYRTARKIKRNNSIKKIVPSQLKNIVEQFKRDIEVQGYTLPVKELDKKAKRALRENNLVT